MEVTNKIPIEIVSEEEMAFLEAALASARPLLAALSPSCRRHRPFCSSPRAAASPPPPPPPVTPDIEDSSLASSVAAEKQKPLLAQFRRNRGLTVTDITATEWCEKQMEFVLLHGRPRRTKAMKVGSDRHAQLEKEVIERVEIRITSKEESWAMKFINFIIGVNQLLFEGLTRELPVIGIVEGTWVVGIIDEIRISVEEKSLNPILVDTKTRSKPTLPAEAQKRNARLQLMCYKYLWDSSVINEFPSDEFFRYFNLNPQFVLSDTVKEYINSMGFVAKTFGDILIFYRDTCNLLPLSKEDLLLRYELQADNSLLEEYHFLYDSIWFEDQIKQCLHFWLGLREPKFVTQDEKWKCAYCNFTSICPVASKDGVNGSQ